MKLKIKPIRDMNFHEMILTSAGEEWRLEDELHEREISLEINRKAASRSRDKKKRFVEKMKSKAKDLIENNEKIRAELQQVQSEILQQKKILYQHRICCHVETSHSKF